MEESDPCRQPVAAIYIACYSLSILWICCGFCVKTFNAGISSSRQEAQPKNNKKTGTSQKLVHNAFY